LVVLGLGVGLGVVAGFGLVVTCGFAVDFGGGGLADALWDGLTDGRVVGADGLGDAPLAPDEADAPVSRAPSAAGPEVADARVVDGTTGAGRSAVTTVEADGGSAVRDGSARPPVGPAAGPAPGVPVSTTNATQPPIAATTAPVAIARQADMWPV